jgi:hypothetical protein
MPVQEIPSRDSPETVRHSGNPRLCHQCSQNHALGQRKLARGVDIRDMSLSLIQSTAVPHSYFHPFT